MKRKTIIWLTIISLMIISFGMGYFTKEYLINKEGYISSPRANNVPLYTQSDEPEVYTITPAKVPFVEEKLKILDMSTVKKEFDTRTIDNIVQHFYTKSDDSNDIHIPVYTYFEINGVNYDLDVQDSIMNTHQSALTLKRTDFKVNNYPVYNISILQGAAYINNVYIIFSDMPAVIAHIPNCYETSINDELITLSHGGGASVLHSIYVWRNDALYLYDFPSYFKADCVSLDSYDKLLRIYRRISKDAGFGDVYRTDFKLEPWQTNSLKLTITEVPLAK